MTVDELRGWRQFRDADGKLCGRFGPDSFEAMPRWREWMNQLQQFRETSHASA
jgi:nicotinic acid mononucleotide adenylyltransferase